MRDLFQKRPFSHVVGEVRERLGGRVHRDKLIEAVKNDLTMAEYEDWQAAAFRRDVLNRAKSRSSADEADAVYGIGEDVAPLRLFTVAEFTEKARQAARLSRANRELVYRLASLCDEVHGVTFDAEEVLAEAAAA